jgi:hypothetical protein
MLVEAAGSVARMKGKNYLSAQHARLTARRGMGRAQIAVAHSILVSAYYMLRRLGVAPRVGRREERLGERSVASGRRGVPEGGFRDTGPRRWS